MDKKTAMEQLFSALVETRAEFSYDDGAVTVGGLTIICRADYIVVSTEQACSYFRYKTLAYISGRGGQFSIADSHVGVFGTYTVRKEMRLIDETERWEDDDDDDNELMDAFLAADFEALS